MAHESWKQESDETGEAPILCINNCGFFGSSMTNNMCSKCYKDFIKLDNAPAAAAAEAVVGNKASRSSTRAAPKAAEQPMPDLQQEGRADWLPVPLRRDLLLHFCSIHRYTDSHQCTFDYKTAAREQIAKQNPVVMAEKINKI
jgi:hypothetical protein